MPLSMWYLLTVLFVSTTPVARTAVPIIVPNDNRVAFGKSVNGVNELALTAILSEWKPEGDKGPTLSVWSFAASDNVARIPSPNMRVPRGTRVRFVVRNSLSDTLAFHLPRGFTGDSTVQTVVPPGATRTTTAVANVVGSHMYWAARPNVEFDGRGWEDGNMVGAIIVDDPAVPKRDDRAFVITESFRFDNGEVFSQLAINGLSWPHTEKLEATVGDSVTWQWLNGSALEHPMHLHGFYFRVTRRAMDGIASPVRADSQLLAVTEIVHGGETMDITFKPTEPGNWVMHCHFAFHVNGVVSADTVYRSIERRQDYRLDGRHMAGLVVGLTVHSKAPTVVHRATRAFRLIMGAKSDPFYFGSNGYSFVKHEGGIEPDSTQYLVPGPVLLLKRDERVAITLVNRLLRPTAVHWHGLEIESFPDGVPHWSGRDGNILHPVAPGDSFTVNFAPPRNGTFIYHSHFNEAGQINGGLYGAIVVVDDTAAFDKTRDHVLVIGGGGIPQVPMGFESPWGLVNGRRAPSIAMKVGQSHRLRFVSIHVDWKIKVSMDGDDGALQWRPVAKDGADLPVALRQLQPIQWVAGPGETADFEVTPSKAGTYTLLVRSSDAGWYVPVTLRVTP